MGLPERFCLWPPFKSKLTDLLPVKAEVCRLASLGFKLGAAIYSGGLALIDQLPGIDAITIDPNGKLLFSAELSELLP